MYIDPKSNIAGLPTIGVRNFLHKYNFVSAGAIAYYFCVDEATAQSVLHGLLSEGYLDPTGTFKGDENVYHRLTLRGGSLANASAAKPLTRKTADKKMSEFLDRVNDVNRNPYFIYKVDYAYVFGSYLSDKERINDIDIAVNVVAKHKGQEHIEKTEARIRQAQSEGKCFRTQLELLGYPYYETTTYLKSRSRALSLHTSKDVINLIVDRKQIYPIDCCKEIDRVNSDLTQDQQIFLAREWNKTFNSGNADQRQEATVKAVINAGITWTPSHESLLAAIRKRSLILNL